MPKRIESIQNWLKPQFIRKIQVFISFANFYKWFIWNLYAIAGLFISMLKTGPGFKSSKLAKKYTITSSQLNSNSFLTSKVKKSF